MSENNGTALVAANDIDAEPPQFYDPRLDARLTPDLDRLGRRRVIIRKPGGECLFDDFVDLRRAPERTKLVDELTRSGYLKQCFRSVTGFSEANARAYAAEQVRRLELLYEAAESGASLVMGKPFSEIEHRPVSWLVYDVLALDHMTLIASPGGVGKSTALGSLSMMVARGDLRPLSFDPTDPGQVVWLAGEDPDGALMRDVLERNGATVEERARIHHVDEVADAFGERQPISLPRDLDAVERFVVELNQETPGAPVRLIVVDTFLSTAHGVNPNDGAEVRMVMRQLRMLAKRTGTAVACLHHFNKSAETVRQAITGSTAFIDDSRLVFALAPDLDNDRRRLLLPVKHNLPLARPFGFAWSLVGDAVCWEAEPLHVTAEAYDREVREAKQRNRSPGSSPEAIALRIAKAASLSSAEAPFTAGRLGALIQTDARTAGKGLQWLVDQGQARAVPRPQGRTGRGGTFYEIT